MSGQPRQVVLSRFFNDNVQLVAKMCPRCYEENVDVKILAVNLQFLKFASKNLQDFKTMNSVYNTLSTQNGFLCFKNTSLNYSENMERYCDTVIKSHDNNNNISFFGFSNDAKIESRTLLKRFKLFKRSVSYKVYKKISLKGLKKLSSRRKDQSLREDHRKSIRRKDGKEQESKYFIRRTIFLENQSNYFSKPTKYANIEIKEDADQQRESKYFKSEPNNQNGSSNYFFKQNDRLSVKIKEERGIKCDHDTMEELEGKDFEAEYHKVIATEQDLILKTDDVKYVPEEKPSIWIPPRSPHNLIEEVLHHDPWALLVATIFLNRTSCMCARPFVFWFLKENPDPVKVLERYPEDLEKYFVKLGLQRTRAVQVWRMSHDFVHKEWKSVKELYGIGKYGEDAFRMFCQGDFSVVPRDRFLRIYKAWYEKVVCHQKEVAVNRQIL